MTESKSILRLRNKHAPDQAGPDIDAQALIDEQALLRAALGALFALVVLNAIWGYSALLFDRFFPWGSVIQGFLIGRAVRHFGLGLDWRFPALAALIATVAAISGSFVAALSLTAREFGTGALDLLSETSWHTIVTFVSREFGVVGIIYALTGAALAAFFASRRLDRHEAQALHKLKGKT
jgi:hypothetical protein